MDNERKPRNAESPRLVVATDEEALVFCGCATVNAVRAFVAFQCSCGWAVLYRGAVGDPLEVSYRAE